MVKLFLEAIINGMMDTSWNEGKNQNRSLEALRDFHPWRYSDTTWRVPAELALAQPTLGEGLDQVAYRGPSQPILACDPMVYTTELVRTAQGEQPNRFLQYFQP